MAEPSTGQLRHRRRRSAAAQRAGRNCWREAWPELEIVAACEDGGAALEAIAEHQPDVAFLDIRMPGLTGLEVAAAAAEASPRTQVVFVTAYDQYAIDAFDKGAVDYLLKPIAPERLAATVQRLQARIARAIPMPTRWPRCIASLGATPAAGGQPPLVWITASAGKETRLIMVDDVAYFQADHKYTVVMTAEGESLLRKPIRELLDVLDPAHVQADPPLHHRQPEGDRLDRPRRHRQAASSS